MSDETQPTSLADLHADLLGRLATGGDSDLLARACRALGSARDEGDVCVDLAAWCTDATEPDEPARPALQAARQGLMATGVVSDEGDEGDDGPTRPLVLDAQDRLYTLRHFRAERRIARFIEERLEQPPSRTPAQVRETLAALGMAPESEDSEPDWQGRRAIG